MGKYQGYDKYKDSGVEWLGAIPNHWEVIPIKFSLSMPITDGPHETPDLLDDGIPFISAEAIKNDQINFDKKRGYISLEEHKRFSKKYKPKYGDVYMVKSGATTGNVARVQTHEEFNIWSPLAALRPNQEKTTTDFLFYVIKSKPFFYSVEQSWSFGTQQNIGMGIIANIRITFPPLEEQEKIARFLDYKTKQIDELIAKKETLIEKLDEKRTSLISHAVTKGLDVNVPMKDSGIEWLGAIPKHWEVKRLKQVTKLIDGDRGKNYPNENDLQDEGIPFLSTENIKFNTFDFSQRTKFITLEKFESLSRGKLIQNDLVVTMRGTIGQTALFHKVPYETAFINAQMIIVRPTNIFAEFLKYISMSVLWAKQLDFYSYGTAQQQLSGAILGILRLGFPPLDEQEKIARFLDQKTAQIDEQKTKIQQAIDLLKEYRTALITNAVTGKIDVRKITIPKI
ncbi:MAG: restriction endonuclease subunit S [Sphaerospermopsis kisseleviana]